MSTRLCSKVGITALMLFGIPWLHKQSSPYFVAAGFVSQSTPMNLHIPQRLHLQQQRRRQGRSALFVEIPPSPSTASVSSSTSSSNSERGKAPYPKVGDVVRYEDLDGGRANGQIFTGRISLIQAVLSKADDSTDTPSWIAEVTQLDDLGDGYFTDFSSRKRASKRVLRPMETLTPLPASFVRSEMAWKVPNTPLFPRYNLVGYKGPQADKKSASTIAADAVILEQDKKAYNALKLQLIRDAALFGLGGTFLVQFLRGLDDALIYFTGALAGVGYLFFLSIKTDTMGSTSTTASTTTPTTLQVLQHGNNIANIRFFLPSQR